MSSPEISSLHLPGCKREQRKLSQGVRGVASEELFCLPPLPIIPPIRSVDELSAWIGAGVRSWRGVAGEVGVATLHAAAPTASAIPIIALRT